jgi:hypothetical protein
MRSSPPDRRARLHFANERARALVLLSARFIHTVDGIIENMRSRSAPL